MEILTAGSVVISVVCIVVVTGFLRVVNWVWLRPKRMERFLRQQGIYGTSYKLLFGDLKDMSSMRTQALKTPMNGFSNDYFPRVDPFRHQLITNFGKDFFLWQGPIPLVHLSKPELVREVFTRIHEFQKPKVNFMLAKFLPGLVRYEGEKWAEHRKLISPAFHVEKLKLMLPAFHDSCAEIISKWKMLVDEMGSAELDVWPDLAKLSADVISRAAFGSNYEEGQMIFELIIEETDLILQTMHSVYIPGFRYIPTTRNRRFKAIEDQIHKSLCAIINKRKEAIEAGEPVKSDLLGILLDSNSKDIQQPVGDGKNQHVGMSLEELIEECKLFYLAGQETTSTLLGWTLILLGKHQDWQARAREEVLQTFGCNVPDFEGVSHLKTVTMILYEVLRLYPPGARLSRRVCKDTNLGAFSVPKDAIIVFSLQSIHQDSDIWGDDAKEFKPERFADGISKASNGNNAFFPFGWGPKICVGEKFAMTEAKLALSMILQYFLFELSPSYVHAPMNTIFFRPQHGAQIIIRHRS
ncbi:unnamed protein product [Amaranthus hypochondriacus]